MKCWCCLGCGMSYPIKPNACGNCAYEKVGSHWEGSGVFVEVEEEQSAQELVARAIIDGRVRCAFDYPINTYLAHPEVEPSCTMIVEPKVEATK